MQEKEIQGLFFDTRKGEYPEEDGWYLVLTYTPFGVYGLMPWYWHCDKKAWTMADTEEKLYMPTEYSLHTWIYYFLEGVK